MADHEGENSIPVLLHKFCAYLSKENEELSAKLFKISLKFLSIPNRCNKEHIDEQQVVSNIRKHIELTQSSEKANDFDLLYHKIQKSSVLHKRAAILSFLLHLSPDQQSDTGQYQMLPSDYLHAKSQIGSSRSQINFLPDDPNVGVKKIFCAKTLAKNPSIISSKRSHVSGNGWAVSEQDLPTSSSCSRQTFLCDLSESQLIQEVIYSFQGIEGKLIRKELGGLGFTIDPKYSKSLTPIQRNLVERLTGVGFLHNQLKHHCDEADKQIGFIGQSLIAILRDELINYYKLIALLQAQTNKQGCMDHSEMTLRRLVVWVAEPQMHLQWLACIAEQCSNKKGGALISGVHGFLQHGSTCLQKVSKKVLSAVCRPLCLMLSNWLLDGELNDPWKEFFIETRSINTAERLWHDKYHVRKAMIPSFISPEQANKILATGKSINFLRQICKDTEELPGRDSLHKLFTDTLAEALFAPEQSIELQATLERVYRETSLRVLDLLKNKYKLVEHLQALRRYLLLGQGDFIRLLLELLAPELSKPALNLYGHTLSAILESAIRATNAQYEDEDTLQRLNVCLLESSRDDTGWDVFTLDYMVDGPVGTIFLSTVTTYKCLFVGLWKAKRMEYVLTNMRKQQITCNKLFKNIKEVRPITHMIHILTSEMIHFLNQTQYYFLFEVLECSWAEMLKQVNQAGCLDDVITAHSTFLNSVQCGVLLDKGSDKLRLQLGLIFNQILTLESLQATLYTAAQKAKEDHEAYRKLCSSTTGFGVTKEDEIKYKKTVSDFHHLLSNLKNQLQRLSMLFKKYVVEYVSLLASSSDMNLQLLSTRLNFNDYYKIK